LNRLAKKARQFRPPDIPTGLKTRIYFTFCGFCECGYDLNEYVPRKPSAT